MTMYTGFEYRRHAETVDRSEMGIEVTHQPIITENIVILVQQSPFIQAGVMILFRLNFFLTGICFVLV